MHGQACVQVRRNSEFERQVKGAPPSTRNLTHPSSAPCAEPKSSRE
eukprot:CAMPEP_0183435456 /NCGR_PEP_ID=MMETSP0370-20130417/68251_1 /TAXON_ID=268820 /ORGANISM="Peridinium aciculiferum, Strain PAER-2" /LENGTH=45 /DNA_ID= /DNA_START= /DNA_END= /DNA_ORIENTATION=